MSGARRLAAIVLGTVDYGEADRVVSLFTRQRGRLAAFARGARASRRRFSGALEPFTLLEAEVRERPGAELLSLQGAAVRRGFGGIRGDLARIACAGYACELARELTRDHEPHPGLFDLLAGYLGRLDAAAPLPEELRAFELGALREAGLTPRLDACARCGADPPREGRVWLDPGQGGILCRGCAARAGPDAVEIRAATAAALARLQAGGLAGARGAGLAEEAGREARAGLCAFIEHHLGRRLNSRRFLDEVGPALRTW